jgi:hypothetical protein
MWTYRDILASLSFLSSITLSLSASTTSLRHSDMGKRPTHTVRTLPIALDHPVFGGPLTVACVVLVAIGIAVRMEVRKGGIFSQRRPLLSWDTQGKHTEVACRACGFVTYLVPVGSVYASRTGSCRMTNSGAPTTQPRKRSGAHDGVWDRAARRPDIHRLIQVNGLDNVVSDNFTSFPCGTARQGSEHRMVSCS